MTIISEKIKQKIGIRFDRLVCLSFNNKHPHKPVYYFNFKCDCGNIIIKDFAETKRSSLKRKTPQSCGCFFKEKEVQWGNKIGTKNNNLTLIEFIECKNNNQYFKYKCDCGNIRVVSYQNFLRSFSCGCKGIKFNSGDIFKNYKILEIKNTKVSVECLKCLSQRTLTKASLLNKKHDTCVCKTGYFNRNTKNEDIILLKKYRVWINSVRFRRCKETDIDFEYFSWLKSSPCDYCGTISDKNGIDRVNSKEGYMKTNSVSCCYICNIMKSNLTLEQFYLHLEKINNHKEKKCRN